MRCTGFGERVHPVNCLVTALVASCPSVGFVGLGIGLCCAPVFEAACPLEMENDGEQPADACEKIVWIQRMKDRLVHRHSIVVWSRPSAVLRRTVCIPEPDAQQCHLDAGNTVLEAVQDVVVRECIAGLDDILAQENAEDRLSWTVSMLCVRERSEVLTLCAKRRNTISLKQTSLAIPRRTFILFFIWP